MDIKQAIDLVKTFNQWRRGETDETLSMDDLGLDPAKIGVALDCLVNFAEVTVITQEFLAGEAGNFSSLSDDEYYSPAGWYRRNYLGHCGNSFSGSYITPTHWMPLPKPPTDRGN